MVNHPNRGKLTVDIPGKPGLYQHASLPGWSVVGTVTRGDGDTGALVFNPITKNWAQANAGAIRSLPENKLEAAINEFLGDKKMGRYYITGEDNADCVWHDVPGADSSICVATFPHYTETGIDVHSGKKAQAVAELLNNLELEAEQS